MGVSKSSPETATPRAPRGSKPRADDGERVPTEQLSQERIVAAALAVAKRVGFDRLTMRALADELGVTPMAAYYYVSSKDQLLELVADAVASDAKPLPPTCRGTSISRSGRSISSNG